MARNSHFQRGTACFTCNSCGRKSRHTGEQAIGVDLCPQCYDLGGFYNAYQDGGIEGLTPYLSDIKACTDLIISKGGTLDDEAEELLSIYQKETAMNIETNLTATLAPKAPAKKAAPAAKAPAAKKAPAKKAPAPKKEIAKVKPATKKAAPAKAPAKKAPAKKAAPAAPRQGTYKDLAANHAGASTAKGPVARMWDLCNEMQQERRKDVIAAAVDAGISYYTARTQYQLWLTAWRNS